MIYLSIDNKQRERNTKKKHKEETNDNTHMAPHKEILKPIHRETATLGGQYVRLKSKEGQVCS
jgi:hypothetical protein